MPDRRDTNFGGFFYKNDERSGAGEIQQAGARPIVLPERIVRALLRSEIERLKNDEEETLRFFEHIFQDTAAEGEVAMFVEAFLKLPPEVTIGYPREIAQAPLISLILASDSESDLSPLGDFLGTNSGDGEEVHYQGSQFAQTNVLYIYAQHPDMCVVLYHLTKLILLGARGILEGSGLTEMSFDGGDVSPQEMPYLPDNVFVRQLSVSFKAIASVPERLQYKDSAKLRIGRLRRSDIVLEGRRGSVKAHHDEDS